MLEFHETDNEYVIVESVLGFYDSTKDKVVYKKDLSQKKMNNESWRDTTSLDRLWFEKHYRKHFIFRWL